MTQYAKKCQSGFLHDIVTPSTGFNNQNHVLLDNTTAFGIPKRESTRIAFCRHRTPKRGFLDKILTYRLILTTDIAFKLGVWPISNSKMAIDQMRFFKLHNVTSRYAETAVINYKISYKISYECSAELYMRCLNYGCKIPSVKWVIQVECCRDKFLLLLSWNWFEAHTYQFKIFKQSVVLE